MKLNRVELLAALDLARPAIASKDLVEELTCLWFDGKTVTAYNDVIGIQAPLETEFVGGLKGSLLLGLLNASKTKEVDISPAKGGGEMVVKAAGTTLKLALLDPKRQIWQFPDVESKDYTKVADSFASIVGKLLPTTGMDTSVPDQLGVTFQVDGDTLHFYATDSKTLSWAQMHCPKGLMGSGNRVVAPTAFCEQLVRLCKDSARVAFFEDCVVAENSDKVRLYARLVDVPRPVDFDYVLRAHLTSGYKKKAVPIPLRLKSALERVAVVLEGHPDIGMTVFVDGEQMRVEAKTVYGEIKDVVKLEKEHGEVEVKLDHALVRRVIDGVTDMWFTQKCLVLLGEDDDYVHLVSAFGG